MHLRINLCRTQEQNYQSLFLRVHVLRILFISALALLVSIPSIAQDDESPRRRGSRIIDDTTKQVYGPTTSKYFFEQDVFFNRHIYHPIDTFIRNFHRFNYVQRNNNLYQDLGNVGTSIQPIYYQTPQIIGVQAGFHSFDLYWDSEKLKYYDTKSPFSSMKVVLGGGGRSITNVAFSRNINPRWNFGFNFRSLLVDKQVPATAGKGDRNVKSTYYDIYTAYESKDSTYRLFFNFRRNHYQADEYGGIQQASPEFDLKSLFFKNVSPWLTTAESRERRNSIHVFHQYQIFGKGFQLYHILDNEHQDNNFYDIKSTTLNETYFDWVEVDSAKTTDGTKFNAFRNEVGLKGNLAKLFYNGYYALRQYNMKYRYYNADDVAVRTKGNEHYLGGKMSLFLDSIGEVNAWAELEAQGNFRIEGSLKSKWFEASLKQLQYSPGFLLQAYRGSHDAWNRSLNSVKVTQLNGYLHYNSKVLNISPGLTVTRLNDYAYFKYEDLEFQKVLPVQSNGTQLITSPELNISLTLLRHITVSSQVIYTKVLPNDDDAISIPDLFVNGQLSYANIFFNGNMDMHAGVDVHWKSAYFAAGYDPVIQQFYRQNSLQSPDFPVIDIFFNMKVKSGRIFVKYNNFLQVFTKSGYMPTPYYPGQRNVFDFGFDLIFFD